MSAVEEELEEGEITDSDSMGEEDQKVFKPSYKPPTQQYSIFGDQPRTTPSLKPPPRPACSDSDSSNSDDDDDDDDDDNRLNKRLKIHGSGSGMDSQQSKPFVNPNFVKSGGVTPPVPKPSNRSIWGSVLQEQILTAEVGSFSMEKKVVSDRSVESYDYTRAKEDDRPFLVEDKMNSAEDDLFGEVIDLEKSALRQQRTLKRKHVGHRLGKRRSVKKMPDLPKVTESSSVEEVTYFVSTVLEESKVHLIRRVVRVVGQAKALDLLKKTEETEAAGGMMTMNGSRRRTKGGVYLMLLKADAEVSKEQLDEIFEEENQWALEIKKRKKARARQRKRERANQQPPKNTTAADKGDNSGSMQVPEDTNSRSSVEGQTGSPRNHADHLSDTQESWASKEILDSDSSDSGREEKSDIEDFQAQLNQELNRQAASREAKGGGEDIDAVTLDDVLDIGVDEEFID